MPPRSQRPLTEKDNEIMVLKQVGKMSNSEIARKMGVTEGTIRYRLKVIAEGEGDKRKTRKSKLEEFREIIAGWIDDQKDKKRRQAIKVLDKVLRTHHKYKGSYDAVRRYVRKHFPDFYKRKVRVRIETPAGRLSQVDWKENVKIQIGWPGNWVELHAFFFTLAFSRKSVMIWSERKDIPSWLRGHQDAFRELGGFPETIRPDCLGSAVVKWSGQQSVITEVYRRYLEGLDMLVFPSRPGTPTDKGKVEKKIRDVFDRLDIRNRVFRDMRELQEACNSAIRELETEWRCGATGLSVAESFAYEREYLKPLPEVFPSFPVREQRCPVRRDMTVYFMDNMYQVPKRYVDKRVLCTFTGDEIVIHHEGKEIRRFVHLPGSRGMVRLNEEVLRDPDIHMSDTVRGWALEVASRQVEIYHEIVSRRPGCN
jgi:transposase